MKKKVVTELNLTYESKYLTLVVKAFSRLNSAVKQWTAKGANNLLFLVLLSAIGSAWSLCSVGPVLAQGINNGNGGIQEVPIGVPITMIVRVTSTDDEFPAPLIDVAVEWSVTNGTARLGADETTTNENGESSNTLTIDEVGDVTVEVSSPSGGQPTPAVFNFTGVLVPMALTIEIVSGNNQTGWIGEQFPEDLVVRVTGPGEGIITVAWAVDPPEAARLDRNITMTTGSAANTSSNNLTIRRLGPVRVTATALAGNQPSVTFDLTAGRSRLNGGGLSDIPGLNEAQKSVAGALDSISTKRMIRGDLKDRANDLKNNAAADPGAVRDALQEIAFEEVSIMGSTAIETSDAQFRNIKTRLAAIRDAERGKRIFRGLVINVIGEPITGPMFASLLPASGGEMIESAADNNASIFDNLEFFINGTLSIGDRDATSREPSFDFDTLGITGGVDCRLIDNLVLGAAFGFANTDNDFSSGSNLDTNGTTVSLYGTYNVPDRFYIDGIFSFGWDHYDLDRGINYSIPNGVDVNQTAKSDTDGRQFALGFSGGYDFSIGGFTIGPFARLNFTDIDIDSFQERITNKRQPGSELNFDIDSQDLKSLTTVLGGQISYAVSTKRAVLLPQLRLEWEHEYEDNTRDIDAKFVNDPFGTPVIIPTEDPDRNFFNIGLGLSSVFPGGKSAFIHYEAVIGREDLTKHSISVGARFEF